MTAYPTWLDALEPVGSPIQTPMRLGSKLLVWHTQVQLKAWPLPAGRTLEGKETWNGKALVTSSDASIERSVGEVELVMRFKRAFPDRQCYWTAGAGNPPELWQAWAFRKPLRPSWFIEMDAEIRAGDDLLDGNRKGLPDIVAWTVGSGDLLCVEYKGPSPTHPLTMDTVSVEQERWLANALKRGFLGPDRYAVLAWNPADDDMVKLRAQAVSSRRGRLVKKSAALADR